MGAGGVGARGGERAVCEPRAGVHGVRHVARGRRGWSDERGDEEGGQRERLVATGEVPGGDGEVGGGWGVGEEGAGGGGE